MILVTGPTGSVRKTTTLYTILSVFKYTEGEHCDDWRSDWVSYSARQSIAGQIPKLGFTFDAGLRSLLRQDPNIIMVGRNPRDEENREISVNAAMTGHLLLSTLHTNDAVTTLPRLAQMGIPPFLIASTTNLIIAQRLVRKVCPYCKRRLSAFPKGDWRILANNWSCRHAYRTGKRKDYQLPGNFGRDHFFSRQRL